MSPQDGAIARIWLREQSADQVVELPSIDPEHRSIFSYVESVVAAHAHELARPNTGAVIRLGCQLRTLNLELEAPRLHQVIAAWPAVPRSVVAFAVVPDVPDSTIWGWSRMSGWTELRRAS